MIPEITVGAASLTAALVAGTHLARWYFRPEPAAPRPLLRPVDALDRFEAHCPFEHRITLHVRYGAGGAECLDCRNNTTQGEPS